MITRGIFRKSRILGMVLLYVPVTPGGLKENSRTLVLQPRAPRLR